MTFQELQHKLGIVDDALNSTQLTISTGDFDAAIDSLLEYSYLSQALVISEAELQSQDADHQTVIIQGKSHFQQMPDLPVRLTAEIDGAGNPQLTLVYDVLGASPDPLYWTLSKSIPGVEVDDPEATVFFNRIEETIEQATHRPLDGLVFTETHFIVTSRTDAVDPFFGRPLAWGTNFNSLLRPEDSLALLNGLMGQSQDLEVTGTIRLPRQGETTALLTHPFANRQGDREFPWEVKDQFDKGLPGLHLEVHLDFNYTVVSGQVDFQAESLHIYSPYDADWQTFDTNPQFSPQQAFTGKLDLPESGINMEFAVPFEWGVDYLSFVSRIEGLSLSALGDLSGMTGTGESLLAKLPDELQDLVEGISALSLTDFNLDLDFRTLSKTHVPYLGFAIGLPGVKWDIWPNYFEISNLSAYFELRYPFETGTDPQGEREFNIRLSGQFTFLDKTFRISASSVEHWTVYAEMEPDQWFYLNNVMSIFGAGLSVPSGPAIDSLRMSVHPQSSFNMAMGLGNQGSPWQFTIGRQNLHLSNAWISMDKQPGIPAKATLGGEVQITNLGRVSIAYDSPGDIVMRSYWESVNVKQLLSTFVPGSVDLPNGLDFNLRENSLLFEKQGSNYSLLLATEIEDAGTMAFQIDKVNGQWGVAFGIDLWLSQLGDLPGLGALGKLQDYGAPNELFLLVSSIDRPNFQFPVLSKFTNPNLSSNGIPVPKSNTVGQGLNLYGSWEFGNGDQGLNTLLKLLDLRGSLDITISVPPNPSDGTELFLEYGGRILGKYDLSSRFGLRLQSGQPEIFLSGNLQVPIEGQTCDFSVAMSVLQSGVYLSGSMLGTVQFGDFQLSNLGLMFGYDWGFAPTIGVMAAIDTPNFSSSMAIVFDADDPTKGLLAGSVSGLSLKGLANEIGKVSGVPAAIEDVLASISVEGVQAFQADASLVSALNNKDQAAVASSLNGTVGLQLPNDAENLLIVVAEEGKRWTLTDIRDNLKHYELELKHGVLEGVVSPQFYFATQDIVLGSFTFREGFRVMGTLRILGLEWTSMIEISRSQGIAATSYLDDPLVIWKDELFKLSDNSGQNGPRFSMATYSRPYETEEALRDPHFILDGQLDLLGISTSAMINFSGTQFAFALSQDVEVEHNSGPLQGGADLTWSVEGSVSKAGGIQFACDGRIEISGEVDLSRVAGVNFNLGKYTLAELGVNVGLEVAYDDGNFSFSGSFGFQLGGKTHNFQFDLNLSGDFIASLVREILDRIYGVIKDLYQTAADWVAAIGDTLIGFGDEIADAAEALAEYFEVGASEMAEHLKHLGADATRITEALVSAGYNLGVKAVAEILDGLGFAMDQITRALKQAMNASGRAISEAFEAMGKSYNEIASAVKNIFGIGAREMAQIFRDMQVKGKDIAKMIKDIYPSAWAYTAGQILKDLGFNAKEIGQWLGDYWGKTVEEIANLLHDIGYSAEQVGKALKELYNQGAEQVSKWLKSAGFGAEAVAEVLHGFFDEDSYDAGKYLKAAGYAANDIAKSLRKNHLWDVGSNKCGKILKKAGFGKSTTKSALRAAGWAKKTVDDVIKSIF